MRTANLTAEAPRAVLFAVVTLCAVGGSRMLHGSSGWVDAAAMVAIAVAIWHGAFDNALAEDALEPRWGARWRWIFYPAYLAAAALCMAMWWMLPMVALVLFLLYSALHFGTESERHRSPAVLVAGTARGLVPIVAACHWWPVPVGAIFAQMLQADGSGSKQLVAVAGALLWPMLAVAAAGTWATRAARTWPAMLLLAGDLSLFRWCPPLVAFAVFFCVWHTPDHLVSTSLGEDGRFEARRMWAHLRAGMWPWGLSVGVVGVAAWLGPHSVAASAGTLFIALSALTVPHMALAELCQWYERHPAPTRANKPGVSMAMEMTR